MRNNVLHNASSPAAPCAITGQQGLTKLEELAARNMVAILREETTHDIKDGEERVYLRAVADISLIAAEELLDATERAR